MRVGRRISRANLYSQAFGIALVDAPDAFWGCTLAVAITFPLVFGGSRFNPLTGPSETHVVVPMVSHANVSPAQFDCGAFVLMARCIGDSGARGNWYFVVAAVPRPGRASSAVLCLDFPHHSGCSYPVTGLALMVFLQKWLHGESVIAFLVLHAITVIAALLYLPFGKFFQIFQRPAQLGASFIRQPEKPEAAFQ